MMNIYIIYLLFVIINLLFLFYYKNIANIIDIYDIPDKKRKLHRKTVPIIGGVIIFLNIVLLFFVSLFDISKNIFISEFFDGKKEYMSFFVTGVLIFFVGLYDDKFNLNYNKKIFLLIILILGTLLINENLVIKSFYSQFLDYNIQLQNFAIFFSVLCILLLINALNMFDGINLQSGLFFSYIFIYLYLIEGVGILPLFLMIPIAIFIILNAKNKIFMGDGGIMLLAYISSFFIINANNELSKIPSEEIFLLLIIPGIDMFRLFMLRISNGKNPFIADYNHVHHLFLKAYGYKMAVFLLQLIILIPLLGYFIFLKVQFAIMLSIIIYLLSLYHASISIRDKDNNS